MKKNLKKNTIIKALGLIVLFLIIFVSVLCSLTDVCKRIPEKIQGTSGKIEKIPEKIKKPPSTGQIHHLLKFASDNDLLELVKDHKVPFYIFCEDKSEKRLFKLLVNTKGMITFKEAPSSGELYRLTYETVPQKILESFKKRFPKINHRKADYGLRFSDKIKDGIQQIREKQKDRSGEIHIFKDESVKFY
ncbi:hypothetical protein ACFL03_08845 [Thermodesulfobacteriota bacterium]